MFPLSWENKNGQHICIKAEYVFNLINENSNEMLAIEFPIDPLVYPLVEF